MATELTRRSERRRLAAALAATMMNEKRVFGRLKARLLQAITGALEVRDAPTMHALPSDLPRKLLHLARKGSIGTKSANRKVSDKRNVLALFFELNEDFLFTVLDSSKKLRHRLICNRPSVRPDRPVFGSDFASFTKYFFDHLTFSPRFKESYEKDFKMVDYAIQHAENFHAAIVIFNRDSTQVDGAPPVESLAEIIKGDTDNKNYFRQYARRVRRHGHTEYKKYFAEREQTDLFAELADEREGKRECIDSDDEMGSESEIEGADLPSETEEFLDSDQDSAASFTDSEAEEKDSSEEEKDYTDDEEDEETSNEEDNETDDEEVVSANEGPKDYVSEPRDFEDMGLEWYREVQLDDEGKTADI